MSLLREWRKWDSERFPYALNMDADILASPSWKYSVANYRSWRKATGDPDFGKPNDKRLHLGLIPVPFMGDMLNALIYVLILNPGLGPSNYFEYFLASIGWGSRKASTTGSSVLLRDPASRLCNEVLVRLSDRGYSVR